MDVFRSLGIIAMIMGHVGFGENFDHFIHAFHMPMFFWISGFFYKRGRYSIEEYIKKKIRTLLIPYVLFGIAHYLVVIIWEGFSVKPLVHLLTINTNGLPIAGALWFLTALFFTDIIYFLLDRRKMKPLMFPLVLIGSFADQLLPYPLPWALSASFVGLGLYWLGEIGRKYEIELNKLYNMKMGKILIAGNITTALIFINGYINMRQGKHRCTRGTNKIK